MEKWYDKLTGELDNYVYVGLALVLILFAVSDNQFASMLMGALLIKIKG
jgi:hypothetical protein